MKKLGLVGAFMFVMLLAAAGSAFAQDGSDGTARGLIGLGAGLGMGISAAVVGRFGSRMGKERLISGGFVSMGLVLIARSTR